ncbi:MAG: VPS10 domain-containing protein, partial [Saprospiraceae bacterium]
MKWIISLGLLALISPLSGQVAVENLFGNLRARQIGPATTSGRISSIDAVHRSPEIIYVGTAGGGVWKSVSGGAFFQPVFDDHVQSIGKIAIDQQHPDTVWVGTGEPWVRNSVSPGNGVYRSTNGGKAWEHLGLSTTERISDILIHPNNPNVVYVAAQGALWNAHPERGVYKTTDGGKSWNKILFIDEHTGAADLSMDPSNPDIIYAAMWSHRRYPDFFDSGLNGKSGLYKTINGGESWDTIHNGLPKETLGRMAVAVAPSNPDLLYLSVECKSKEGKGLYLSTDKGASWEKVSSEFNTTVRPFYFSHLVVDPKNDSIVMKAGLSLIISENRGKSFRSMDGSVHSDIHAVWIDPNHPKHVLLGSDGGVYESFDRGASFKMFMNLPVAQFYHVSVDNEVPYNVYGGLQDNGSWYAPSRKPGGIGNADWKPTFGGDGFWSFPHPTNSDIVFSEYQGGNLVRFSKKTGMAKEIRPIPEPGEPKYRFNWNAPIHISPNNPNRMYFGAQFLFRSDDMGDSWVR